MIIAIKKYINLVFSKTENIDSEIAQSITISLLLFLVALPILATLWFICYRSSIGIIYIGLLPGLLALHYFFLLNTIYSIYLKYSNKKEN